ncbi:methyltransferase domain-containing protein [Candidatus Parcubacteria bacterium]|nr:methyltransferase domain-containing protein [Candidatus Parcubacteria bacterium]
MHDDADKNALEFGFTPGQKVADLGSGAGHYTYALSKVLGPSGRVCSVDLLSERLVRLKNVILKHGRENVDVIWGDIETKNGTHLRDGIFDGAVFSNILFRLKDPEGAAREANRILKPGGKVCIVEWSSLEFLGTEQATHEALPPQKAQKLFESCSFSLDRVFDAGEHHYGLIFKKNLK